MYGQGSISPIVTGSVTTGSGIAVLPHTSGNTLATVLAVTAITFGFGIILSQIVVRVLRKKYQQ